MQLKRIITGSAVAALALAGALPALAGQAAPAAQAKPATATVAVQGAQAKPEPFDVNVARRMSIDEIKARLDKKQNVVVLDVRGSTGGQMAKGAMHVPMDQVETWAKDKAKDTLIVAYCT